MSDTAKQLFDGLRAAKDAVLNIAPGLQNMGPEISAELSRLGTQGSMELSAALFNGSGFVPYGPGQYTDLPTPAQDGSEIQQEQQVEQQQEMSRER
ncbi:MAG: hypothetical protein KDA63_14525 [Planctomycetales bacterium]|nr:hypothetical protein [Planctomycetales bacterium]